MAETDIEDTIYQELVKERSPEFFCDNCGHYPIEPVHGHFMCPNCHMPTKCCEGMPMEMSE
jgi:Zn finger protein HypA/HybF involved in hydrogenase expression